MLSSIAAKTLRDGRRSLVWWVVGLGGLCAITVFTYPFIRDMPGLDQLLKQMPDALLRLIGDNEMLSPEGYLNSQLFGIMVPFVFLFFGVAAGAGAVAGEEENRTLDLLLANPVTRTRLVVDKTLAMMVGLVLLGMALWALTYIGSVVVDMGIDPVNLAAITLSAVLFGFFMGTFGLAVGAATGSRALAIGLAAALGVVSYLVNSLAPLVDALEPLQKVSPFYWYFGADPLRNGLDPLYVALLAGLGLAFVVLGIIGFRRRDVGV